MVEEIDRVIERVQKLLALSASQNPHEAALAAAKAQEILFKHNLSLALVEAGTPGNKRSPYTNDRFDIGGWMQWRRALLESIVRNNFCRAVSYSGTRDAGIVGEPHNIAVVKYLYAFLVSEIIRLASEAAGEVADLGAEDLRQWKRSFYQGAVRTIARRLAEQHRQNATADQLSTALVIRKDRELEAVYHEYFPNVKQGRSAGKPRHPDGYRAGVRAARSIPLSAALGETSEQAVRRQLESPVPPLE